MKATRRSLLRTAAIGCGGMVVSHALSRNSARADDAPSFGAEITKRLDLRARADASTLFVILNARDPSKPDSKGGHAYAVWGKDSPTQPSVVSAYGLFPVKAEDGKWSLLRGPIPGKLIEDTWVAPTDTRLIVVVGKSRFDAADGIRNLWTLKAEYHLLDEDCASFVAEVGKALGLTVPDRGALKPGTWFPSDYIRLIASVNDQRKFADGIWDSADAGRRFHLEIDQRQCTWVERNTSGAEFRRSVSVQPVDAGFKLLRDNDAATLSFMGARPKVASQILAKGPQPSFLQLSRVGEKAMTATWSGLFWELDRQGNLTNLFQPGTGPKASVPVSLNRAF